MSAPRLDAAGLTSGPPSGFSLLGKSPFGGQGVHYNSTRLPGSDRLDSSPLTFTFAVPRQFAEDLDANAAAVHVDIVYFNGEAPKVFVEDARGNNPASFRLSHIPAPRVVSCEADGDVLTVQVDRKFPLSSSHGLRKFRLAFTFTPCGASVLTEPFTVLAKKAKKGVGVKLVHKPTLLPVDAAREARLARLAALCQGGAAQGVAKPAEEEGIPKLPVPVGATPDGDASYFDSLFDASLKRTAVESVAPPPPAKRVRTKTPGDSPDTVITSAPFDCGTLLVDSADGLDTDILRDLFDAPLSPRTGSPFAAMLEDLSPTTAFDLEAAFV